MTDSKDSDWDQIKQSYLKYLQESKEKLSISIGDADTGYPLRDVILQEMSITIRSTQVAQEHLISGNSELPDIDELSPVMLAKVSSELSNILQVAITEDHLKLWERTYYTLDELSGGDDEFISQDIWNNLQIFFDLVLCEEGSPVGSRANDILFKTNFIAGYLAYPILEGLLKRLCSDDIKNDGTVKSPNSVYNLSKNRYYSSDELCNSLTDILYHFENEVADNFLSNELERKREFIAKFGKDRTKKNAYGLIYSWRNSLLHGENQADVQYAISLNIICLIIWHYISKGRPIMGDWES